MQGKLSDIDRLKYFSVLYNNLGMEAFDEKNYERALFHLQNALISLKELLAAIIKISPTELDVIEELKQGISYIDETIIDILKRFGDDCFCKNKKEDAIKYYKEILNYEHGNWRFYYEMGKHLKELEEYYTAVSFLGKAASINPDNATIYWLIADIYHRNLKQANNAINYFKKYTEKEPQDAIAYNIIGNLYGEIDKNTTINQQIEYFEKALQIDQNFSGAIRNLAFAYQKVEKYEEAVECFEKLFKLNPVNDDYFAYACLKIKLKDFEKGWKYYEYRFSKTLGKTEYPEIEKPRWEGQEIKGKTLLVQYEQGFGDSIQFFRYLPQLKTLAAKIIFRVQNSLLDLIKNNAMGVELVPESTPIEELSFDYHIPIMSLMKVLSANAENIPFAEGYIKADENKIESYKKEYFDNDCLKVGITWNGAIGGHSYRNVPLETFYPLTKIKNVKVYSLQKEPCAWQLKTLPPEVEIVNLGEGFKTFSDTAAAIANLDLFITSDNSVFNLAGAMGKKTFLLLNKNAEWRWFLDDKRTPWYKSVQIFKKQHETDSWDSVMQKVIEKLKA